MLKTIGYSFLATIIALNFMGATTAAAADLPLPALGAAGKTQHVSRCSANNFLRLGGAELQSTNITLRNFDPVHPVSITRLVIFNATGTIIYDSTISGLPAFSNGILGPTNDTLSPRQSSTLGLDEGFLPFQDQNSRPLQLLVAWSSAPSALPLSVTSTRFARQRDPATGAVLAERSRSGRECETGRRPLSLN
jgi:hypothetical protein